jgi:hypothetical protein
MRTKSAKHVRRSGKRPRHRVAPIAEAHRPSRYLPALAGLFVVLTVASPLLFTSRGFNLDLTNNLWLGNVQRYDVLHGIFPTYFTNTTGDGIFNPIYAFYGGSVYAVLGVFTFLLGGSVVAAQDLLTVAAIGAAYGGIYWIGRQYGLSTWYAQTPALAFTTSAYFVTDLYGRGDWLEFIAVSSIPLVVAGALDRLYRGHWTFRSLVLFTSAVFVFTGSHNITLLWGTLFLVAAGLILLVFCGKGPLSWSSVRSLAVVGLLATLVNGWALIPDLLYASKSAGTLVGRVNTFFFDSWTVVLSPLRVVPKQSTTPALFVQSPLWFIAWSVLGGGLLLLVNRRSSVARPWLAVLVLLALTLGVILLNPLWAHMPRPLLFIQFPYRLNNYVALSAAALTGATLLMSKRGPTVDHSRVPAQALRYSLAFVVLVSFASCVWQLWVPNTVSSVGVYANRSAAATSPFQLPLSWYELLQYSDRSEPVIAVTPGRDVSFSPLLVDADGSGLRAKVLVPPGTAPFLTNIVAGPYLANIGGGIERVGRSAGGYAVVRRIAPGRGRVAVVIETAASLGVVLGRTLSVISVLLLLLIIGIVARRRSTGSDPPSTERRIELRARQFERGRHGRHRYWPRKLPRGLSTPDCPASSV